MPLPFFSTTKLPSRFLIRASRPAIVPFGDGYEEETGPRDNGHSTFHAVSVFRIRARFLRRAEIVAGGGKL